MLFDGELALPYSPLSTFLIIYKAFLTDLVSYSTVL